MNACRACGVGGMMLLIQGTVSVHPQDSIPPEQFAKLHALIKPTAGEQKWEQIPWLTSLWDARQRAAAEKPILL